MMALLPSGKESSIEYRVSYVDEVETGVVELYGVDYVKGF